MPSVSSPLLSLSLLSSSESSLTLNVLPCFFAAANLPRLTVLGSKALLRCVGGADVLAACNCCLRVGNFAYVERRAAAICETDCDEPKAEGVGWLAGTIGVWLAEEGGAGCELLGS